MYVIWNDSISLGDVICTFPAIAQLTKIRRAFESDDTVGVMWSNEAAADLFEHRRYGVERVLNKSKVANERVSIHDMVHKGGPAHKPLHVHPTAQFMAHVGFPELSGGPIKPDIYFPVESDIKTYDVIIAPYILAEIWRFWPLDRWQSVIDWLHETHPELTIGCLASSRIPPLEQLRVLNPPAQAHFASNFAHQMQRQLHGVEYIIDRPLREVAHLLHKAQYVITVDSGPARLMHGLDRGATHLLLASNMTARDWCSYPGVRLVHADMTKLMTAEVIAAVDEMISGRPVAPPPKPSRMPMETRHALGIYP